MMILIDLANKRRAVGVGAPINRNRPFKGRLDHQAVKFDIDNDEEDLDGIGSTGAVILPPLAPG